MIIVKILILAIIGAMIGWITNIIAIKLIFRPLNPIKIPLINVKLQGLIPKRKDEIAKSIGNVVESELLSVGDLLDEIITEESMSNILFIIKRKINYIIDQKIPSIVPRAIKNMIFDYINELVDTEGEKTIKDLAQKIIDKTTSEVSVAKIVEDKINSFELYKMEELVLSVAKKELKHIEILGGVLGFIIGIIQGIIVMLF